MKRRERLGGIKAIAERREKMKKLRRGGRRGPEEVRQTMVSREMESTC
jgi:hypothetical protein